MLNPSSPLEWILTILLFALSLGVLITLHELGHLTMAKIFKVYCQEFSIGFGPALLHVRGKGKETYFSIRAIPLGGYVSMYGEDTNLEDGVNIPKSRSLEGIHRGKKALILSAGIIMNIILAFTLFFASNVFFPLQKASVTMHVEDNSIASHVSLKNEDKLYFVGPVDETDNKRDYELKALEYRYETSKATYAGVSYIIDEDVELAGKHYMVTYAPQGAKKDTVFTSGISLYVHAESESEIASAVKHCEQLKTWNDNHIISSYIDFANQPLTPTENMSFEMSLLFKEYYKDENGKVAYKDPQVKSFVVSSEYVSKDTYKWGSIGLSLKVTKEWLSFGERLLNTLTDFGSASTAVFQGLASLFTGGFKNISGIVGIFTTSASVYSSYSFSTYLFFWGLISVNLAIFNLLPFPGLDGWQLVVTIVEGSVNLFKRNKYKKSLKSLPVGSEATPYEDWKIPTKVKSIMSFIGLGLLFALGIAIIVLDIIRLF